MALGIMTMWCSIGADPNLNASTPTGTVRSWGSNSTGQQNVPIGLNQVKMIASGNLCTFALKSDGTVAAWGINSQGQLNVPANLQNITSVAVGSRHVLALKEDGTVVAWGNSFDGTQVPAGLGGVIAVAAGYEHSLALKADGSVTAWGHNANGQINVPAGLSGVVAIAAGDRHSVALKTDGTVVVWGSNLQGQRAVPSGLTEVVAIAAAKDHTVALKSDGTGVAWGYNPNGQAEWPYDLDDVVAISTCATHTVALKRDHSLVSWGLNAQGQCLPPLDLSGVMAIATGYTHTVALVYDELSIQPVSRSVAAAGGSFEFSVSAPVGDWTWVLDEDADWLTSDHANEQDGNLTFTYSVAENHSYSPRIAKFVLTDGIVSVTHTLTQMGKVPPMPAGSVRAWGSNFWGETNVPPGLGGVRAISAGRDHSLALRTDGTVAAWGMNNVGQTNVPAGLDNVVAIEAGWNHNIALKSDGTVVVWGEEAIGYNKVPVGLNGVVDIEAGPNNCLALMANGKVVAWGYGSSAMSIPLGLDNVLSVTEGIALRNDGTVVWLNKETPPGFHDIIAVSGNSILGDSGRRMVLKADGSVSVGALSIAIQLPELDEVVAISAGENHYLALQADGRVLAWGQNNFGETQVPSPMGTAIAIAGGGSHSLALVSSSSFSARPASRRILASAGSFDFQVAAPDGPWSWTVSEGSYWLSSQQDAVQNGPQIFNFSADANSSLESRLAAITLTRASNQIATHLVTQMIIGPRMVLEGDLLFGEVDAFQSPTRPLAISNSGNKPLVISDIIYPSRFRSDWKKGVIPPGGSQIVHVAFDPFAAEEYGGTVTILSNTANGTHALAASGTGLTRIIGLTGNMQFGEVQIVEPADRILTITNWGGSPLDVSGIEFPDGFSSDWTSGSISPGSSQNVTITFAPTQVRNYSGSITILSNATSGTGSRTVSGSGTPELTLSITSEDWNALPSGGSNNFNVMASWKWSWSLSGGQGWIQTSEALNQTGNRVFSYTVTPNTSVIPRTAMITLTSGALMRTHTINQPGRSDLALSGNGVQIANGDATPSLADHTDFGIAAVDGDTATRTFVITNPGDTPLVLTTDSLVEIVGPFASEFELSNPPAAEVAKGGLTSFAITFNPGGAGLRSATVRITSNAPGNNPFLFAIQGSGTVPPGSDSRKPRLTLATPSTAKTLSAALPFLTTGTVQDNQALDRIEIVLNGDAPEIQVFAEPKPASASFSVAILPKTGIENTLQVTAYDRAGNSTSTSRRFVFERRYRLSLHREVPAVHDATPNASGTLALKASPAKNATALSKGAPPQSSSVLPGTQVTVTASAKTRHVFSHWSGLPTGALVAGNVARFTMPSADVALTAAFVANPFLESSDSNPFTRIGANQIFQGLLMPDTATVASHANVGSLTGTVLASRGSLSGKVFMDGKSTHFTGVLQGDGSVWFKLGKSLNASLPLRDHAVSGKSLAATWTGEGLQAVVTGAGGAVTLGLARPKVVHAPEELMNRSKGRQGYFTLMLPTHHPVSPQETSAYPQGTSYATLVLTQTGLIRLAAVLADGTVVTGMSYLVNGNASPVYLPLTTPGARSSIKGGSTLGLLSFDSAQEDSDVTGANWQWFRPKVIENRKPATHLYTDGWPQGIPLAPVGALYDSSLSVQNVLDLDDADPLSGNARLLLQDGKLLSAFTISNFFISGNKVTKIPVNDKSFSLSLAGKTGVFNGTFTPNWAATARKLPVFQGVILQKGIRKGGFGFFISNAIDDRDPESGRASLQSP